MLIKIQGQRYGTYLHDIRIIIVDISRQYFSIHYSRQCVTVKYGMETLDLNNQGFSIGLAEEHEQPTIKYGFNVADFRNTYGAKVSSLGTPSRS